MLLHLNRVDRMSKRPATTTLDYVKLAKQTHTMPRNMTTWELIINYLDRPTIQKICVTDKAFNAWCNGKTTPSGRTVWDRLAHSRYGAPYGKTPGTVRHSMMRYKAYGLYNYIKQKALLGDTGRVPLYTSNGSKATGFNIYKDSIEIDYSDILVEAIQTGIIPKEMDGMEVDFDRYEGTGRTKGHITYQAYVIWNTISLETTKNTLIGFLTLLLEREYDLFDFQYEKTPELALIRGGICSVCNTSMCGECFETHKLDHE